MTTKPKKKNYGEPLMTCGLRSDYPLAYHFRDKEHLKSYLKTTEITNESKENDLINIILDWMREHGYGNKDGHAPAMILADKIIKEEEDGK